MIKYLLPTALLLLLVVNQTFAQRPTSTKVIGNIGKTSVARAKMDCNDAGTIQFGAHRGQSNDVAPDTIYLCFGDELDIVHSGGSLSGDPQSATTPGFGYVFYDCPPSITGPNLDTIQMDSCINRVSPIVDENGMPIIQDATFRMWVSTENANGNITFVNDGFLQAAFNNNVPKPIQFWFAPITLDDFAGQAFENGGTCVDVGVDQAFAVVYLNAIEATDINTNASATGCRGSFILKGGLPELDPLTRYNIDISLASDPSVKGRLESVPMHNDTVEFFVPQAGMYNITIEDGKSCGTSFTMDMSGCTAVTFTLPAVSALPGDNVCVNVSVENFNGIGTAQFTVQWDPTVLEYASVGGFNPELTGLESGSFNPNQTNGVLTFAWFDTDLNGATLPDSSSLFEICFNVIGALGEESPLTFTNTPTEILVGDTSLNDVGYILRNGIVAITTNEIITLFEQDSVSCPNATDGGFTMSLFGGTPPYSFTWRPLNPPGAANGPFTLANTGQTFNAPNLGAGRYEVVIQDSANPTNNLTDTVQVLRGPLVGVNLEIVEPSCNGESTGSLRANVTLDGVRQTNPENNFTFTWNFLVNGNISSVDSIPSGNYAVTVTDANGCTALASTTLSQPSAINAVPTVTNATCTGSGNGAISLAVTGGIGAYTFQWSDDATINSANRTNINPGPYRVTITDGNGCAQAAGPFTVGAVKTLSIQQLTLSDVTCNGDDNGQISVRGVTVPVASQSLPYTFNWQGPGVLPSPTNTQTESTLTNLIAGTYILTLIDSDPQGCQVSDTFEIIEPAALDVTLADSQNETCLVGNDGSATPAVTGGTLPYVYAWSDGQTDSIATNLSAGTYVAVVTDNSGCMDSLNVDILAPTPPTIQPIDTDTVSCQNSTDGSLTVTATPVSGTTITGYQWNNGQSGQTINNLSPGAYVVNVTASDGCINSDTAFVVAPTPLVIDSIVTVSPTCVGFDNGRLTVFASGGTAPYRYIWANTPQNDTLNANVYGQLTAGTYQVTVVDANNCAPATSSATLTDPPSIDIAFSGVGGVSCFENTCDGTATATAIYSDGTPGTFIFSWQSGEVENGVASSTAIQLCAGAQVLVATDANNCFGIDTVSIPSPPAITVQVNAEPVTCNGLSDGTITLVPGGGTPPFSIQWVENGATGDMISNLMAGIYNAILTDSNGCTKTQIVELSEPDALELTLDPAGTTASVTCNGDTDGQITVQYNSGANINPVGPDPFTWSNGVAPATSASAIDLAPGTYAVTITDVKGCTDTLSYTILNPEPIVAVIPQPTDPLCFGESTIIVIDTVYGGTGTTLFDYTYELNNNGLRFTPDQPATVFAGIQIITVEDPGGCAFIDTIEINQPDELQVVFDPAEIEVELGDSTTLQPIISSSLPIGSYSWTPDTYLSATNVEIPVVSPQSDEVYTLTVVDVNGCAGVGTVRVDVDFSRNVYIPNVFSPNGDGPNDDFRIFTCNGVENIKTVHIFDRWGNLMFTTNDLAPICSGVKLWDGRLNNKLVNPGVYVYMIEVEFLDKISLTYRGDVTLIR